MFKLCVFNRFTSAAPLKLQTTVQCLLLVTVPKYIISNVMTTTTRTVCDRCEGLLENLTEIERALSETKFPSDDENDEAVFLFRTAKRAILSWKNHILRSTNQDRARLDVLEQLDEENILLVNDWAMKFLPQRYRESQAATGSVSEGSLGISLWCTVAWMVCSSGRALFISSSHATKRVPQ